MPGAPDSATRIEMPSQWRDTAPQDAVGECRNDGDTGRLLGERRRAVPLTRRGGWSGPLRAAAHSDSATDCNYRGYHSKHDPQRGEGARHAARAGSRR